MTPQELQTPPTEIEIAELLHAASSPDHSLSEKGRNILRRLAFAYNLIKEQSGKVNTDQLFRESAENNRLIVHTLHYKDKSRRHHFDLNAGSFYSVDPEPAKVREIIELSRKVAGDMSGDHNAMVQLVALKSELEKWEKGEGNHILLWHRSYYVIPIRTDPATRAKQEMLWISLMDWLKQHNQEPNIG